MSEPPVDPTRLCVDCLATHTDLPRPREGRSPRCKAHRKARHLFIEAERQAQHRAQAANRPTPQAREYRPSPLPARPGLGSLLSHEDLDLIAATIVDLTDAHLHANNAYRRDDENALRAGLRDLLDKSYETIQVIRDLPAIRARIATRITEGAGRK